MIDYARISVSAGDGGNGAGSFRHIKGRRYGRADGGDGGGGGSVYIEATGDLNTLERFRYVKDYKAESGQHGSSNRRRGADGKDLILKVPVGTEIRSSVFGSQLSDNSQSVGRLTGKLKTGKQNSDNREQSTDNWRTEVYDLAEPGQKVLVARGGEGGRGNSKLRDEFGRRPRAGEVGYKGEICQLTVELKLIADVGLIGLPNAGKSTLLAKLTAAKPMIANYPFTTLEPNLGVLTLENRVKRIELREGERIGNKNYSLNSKPYSLIIADIPGLIEGASQGRGLGVLFLRHIERTKLLVHLIDVSSDEDIWDTYQTVRRELKLYSKELVKKKEIIVLSKIDLVGQLKLSQFKTMFTKRRKKVMAISARDGLGLDLLIGAISRVRVEPSHGV